MVIPPSVLLLLRIVFAILCFMPFQMNLKIALFHVNEELCWDFDGNCIESVDSFWQDNHFYYINPPNPGAWEIFPSSEIFLDFFLQRLEVLVMQIL